MTTIVVSDMELFIAYSSAFWVTWAQKIQTSRNSQILKQKHYIVQILLLVTAYFYSINDKLAKKNFFTYKVPRIGLKMWAENVG